MTHDVDGGRQGTTLLRLSDEAWESVRAVLETYDSPRRLGRKRVDPRGVLEAILYRLHSGCTWNSLPKEYPDDSTVHRTYQRWQCLGVLDQLLDILEERPASGSETGRALYADTEGFDDVGSHDGGLPRI